MKKNTRLSQNFSFWESNLGFTVGFSQNLRFGKAAWGLEGKKGLFAAFYRGLSKAGGLLKKALLVGGLFFTGLAPGYAQDAQSIVRSSRDRIAADTVSSRSRMVITAKDGTTSERVLDQYSKDGPRGSRTIVVFQRPPSVANTRFLTMENPGNPDDRWIFLPALGKVRRIAASEGSGSFMGTDFSYDDISSASRNAELDTHTLLREENLNSRACFVIESTPKDTSYQYSKMVQWIDKSSRIAYKIELYDRRGTLVKQVEILEVKEIQGRLSPVVTRMTTVAAGTTTTITMDILKYDDPIPEGVFTTAYLETGRPR
ncbi:MAG: outer membrane lipoprotein-sorting protein [Spirochaetaceae bacterium]|jgi:outer membrane lipoprotein-sorting protein|nr:outer membrane lipoprotein-sorting protein [Spirochaetaceae bacterium]